MDDLLHEIEEAEARVGVLIEDAQRRFKSPESARALLLEAEVLQLRAIRMQMAISFPAIIATTEKEPQ